MSDLDLELLASIASGGLGSWQQDAQENTVYVKSEDCRGCLRDLQRFFRYDDPEQRPAFFAVSKYNFARSDLVPLIVTYPDDYDVVYNALKVATFLTMPSSDPLVTSNKAKQEEHMQAVREAFLAQDALAAVVGMLAEPLSRHPRMSEQDAALTQLVITFLKNLVAIPEAPPAAAAGGGAAGASKHASRRIQTGLLERLFGDNVMDLLLLLAQHSQQRPFRSEAPVLVELFMHLFCGVDPQQLLDAPQLLEAQERRQREEQAAACAAAEKKRRQQQQQQQRGGSNAFAGWGGKAALAATTAHLPRLPALPQQRPFVPKSMLPRHVAQAAPSRHAHSGAVYVRRHTEHSSNIVLRHNPLRSELPRLPAVADAKKAPAQRKDGQAGAAGGGGGAHGGVAQPRLGAELLVRLDAFLQQFLEGAYDILMTQVFREVQPGLNISRLGDADFMHFVRLATYCTRYVRLKEERKLQARLQAEKDGGSAGVSPVGGAGADGTPGGADVAPGGEDEASPFSSISATMGWDCFHWVTMLWIMLSNMEGGGRQKDHSDKNWDLQHASVPLLKEMLLALDLARVAGNAADRRAADRLQRRLLHDDLKESGLLPVLSRLIKGYNFRFQPRSHAVDLIGTLHVVLGMLDRLSSAEPGGFRVRAAARQGGGRRKKPAPSPADKQPAEGEGAGEDAAAANDDASQQQQQPGEEGAAAAAAAGGEEEQQQGSPAGSKAGSEGGDDELAQRVGRSGDPLDDDGEFDRPRAVTREVAFEAARRIRQECAQPVIVHFYAWLLQGYRTNAPFTNHAILSFLRRIAEPRQLNLEPMLYQLSVLRLFEAILSDLVIKRNPDYAELIAFAKGTVRNMFARMVPDLSELRQKAGEVEANLDARFAAAEGGGGEQEADSAEQEARRERRLALAEVKARENAANALFVELLFWKGANVAEDVRNEYNWRGLVDPQEHRRRGGRRGRGSALGDDEGSDGEQLGFASFRKKGTFTEEQAALLQAEFEKRNGRKGCLDALVFEFGGQWKKGQISRQLKAMGLACGKFTQNQDERLAERYEEVRGRLDCFQLLAEELDAGFTANQVKFHLRKIGVVAGRKGAAPKFSDQQVAQMKELYAERMASKDCFDFIAEELGGSLTARQVKRHLQKLGIVPHKKRRQQQAQGDAAFDALAASSGDEAGGAHQRLPRSDGGSGSDSESDGGASGFGSARSELEEGSDGGGSDSDGGSSSDGGGKGAPAVAAGAATAGRVQGKAARRQAALEALQSNAGRRKVQRQHAREMSPELGAAALGSEDEEDGTAGDGDSIAAQQAAAAAAAASPTSSDGGGSFVSLLDSDGDGGAAAGTDAEAPASKKPKRGPAAAGADAADNDSDGAGGSGSEDGFESARESEPAEAGNEEEEAAPARQRKRQPAAQKQQQKTKKARRQGGEEEGGRRQQRHGEGRGTPGTKRKVAEEAAGPSSAQKRAALDALRQRRQQVTAAAAPASLPPATEPLAEWRDAEEEGRGGTGAAAGVDENAAPQAQQAGRQAQGKPAGKRRLMRGGGDGAAAAPAPVAAGLEDLEDDI